MLRDYTSLENGLTVSGVYRINPLRDPRWETLVRRHPHASVFHSSGWLEALRRTYDYEPIVFTTTPPGSELNGGMLFCSVKSWLTGRRLVSLPFSDHCDPLVDSPAEWNAIREEVQQDIAQRRYSYAEVRPYLNDLSSLEPVQQQPCESFAMHSLPLGAPLENIFKTLHKDCIQRKVRRAEKENLTYEKGRSEQLLRSFYQLLIRTRRRHCLPPQPFQWFSNLAQCMGEHLNVHVASKDGQPVASLLTLEGNKTTTYKYGCSDERFSNMGGTPFLFWKLISEAKASGMVQIDLGRSELDNAGLIEFKDRLGATKGQLNYYRFSSRSAVSSRRHGQGMELAKWVFNHMPDRLLVASGRLLYRHMS
jgi:hypothetical protein